MRLAVTDVGCCAEGVRSLVNVGRDVVYYNPGGRNASAADRELAVAQVVRFDPPASVVGLVCATGGRAEVLVVLANENVKDVASEALREELKAPVPVPVLPVPPVPRDHRAGTRPRAKKVAPRPVKKPHPRPAVKKVARRPSVKAKRRG